MSSTSLASLRSVEFDRAPGDRHGVPARSRQDRIALRLLLFARQPIGRPVGAPAADGKE